MLATDLAVLDHTDGSILLVANAINYDDTDERVEEAWADAVARLDAMTRALAAPAPQHRRGRSTPTPSTTPWPRVRSNTTRERYEEVVEHAKEDIRAGEVFQVVLSQRFSMDCAADPLDVYRVLRATNPSPYMYLFRLPHPDGSSYDVVGSSPEALVQVTGERAITHPIAGSRPRGKTPEDDVRLAEELLADPKERAEHVMLVDLGRNDLQRVCRAGHGRRRRVHGRAPLQPRHAHRVHGRRRHPRRASAPTTSSSRPSRRAPSPVRPKPRALALIEELEPSRRGVYGGVVGYLDFDGDLDMAIAIRTARHHGRRRPRPGRRRHRRRLGARPRVRGVRAQGGRGPARGRDRRGDADRHVRRAVSSKGVVVLLALVGAGLLLVSAFRPWVTGAVDDAVLGATRISATGAEVAPGPERRRPRDRRRRHRGRRGRPHRRAIVAVVAYAVVPSPSRAALAVRVLLDPEGVLGPVAASRVGRTGSVETVADPTIWPWVALARLRGRPARAGRRGASACAAGAARRSATRCPRRRGPTSPVRAASGSRSDWDELSAGRDPTDVGPDAPT